MDTTTNTIYFVNVNTSTETYHVTHTKTGSDATAVLAREENHSSNIDGGGGLNGSNPSSAIDTTHEINNNGYHDHYIMSDEMRIIFEMVNCVALIGLISSCGIVSNIINIVVFVKMGIKDSISVSLFSLAVSDLCASIAILWRSICFNPLFAESGIPFNSQNVQYITGAWIFGCFARTSCFITAYITFERCLCIVKPLKVRTILTPRKTSVVIVVIYLSTMASVSPVYFGIGLGWVFDDERNKSLIDIVYYPNGYELEKVTLFSNSIPQQVSFFHVIICSLFLVNGLRRKSKWRQKSAANAVHVTHSVVTAEGEGRYVSSSTTTTRDDKVIKMILVLATVFIVSYIPVAINLTVMTTSTEYSIVGRYKNMFQAVWSSVDALQSINSSVNMCIYIRMSSKYRRQFQTLFGLTTSKDVNDRGVPSHTRQQ